MLKAAILDQVLHAATQICRKIPKAAAMAENTFIDDCNFQRWKDVFTTGLRVFMNGIDGATSVAQTSGGGGTSNDMPWRDRDEDFLDWPAVLCDTPMLNIIQAIGSSTRWANSPHAHTYITSRCFQYWKHLLLFEHLSEGILIFRIVSDKWNYHLVLMVGINVTNHDGGSHIYSKNNLNFHNLLA